MGKTTSFNLLSKLSFCLALLLIYYAEAQVQTPFTPRYSEAVKGEFTIIANNMVSRTPTNDYNGNQDNHDFNDNVYVDIDSDNTTFNSSSANFSNPDVTVQCISIYKAFLYWAAADKEQDNGDDNQPNWNFDDIKIMFPGETTYTTMTADDVIYRGRDFHFSNDPYVCFKDITADVMALPNVYGTYQVANVEGKIDDLTAHGGGSPGTSGGWQIVFVYQSPDLPSKNITLFDGYAHVTSTVNDFDIDFSGFQTVPSGNVNSKVLFGSLEGDRDLFGDRLQIRNVANNFVDITAPLRDSDNFFNSRITIENNEYLDRNPASANTLGFDAGVFQLDNPGNSIIANNQTATTLRLTSNIEVYGLFLLGLSIEVYAPDLHPTLITQTAGTNPANPEDILGFNINLVNNGNDDAANVVYSTTLPAQVSLASVTNLPNAVTYTYNALTGALSFNIDDGYLDVNDPDINIEFELEVNNACYFLEDTCDLSFDLQFTANYSGVANPDIQTSLSTSDLNACESLPLSVNINQPVVNWATSAGALDTTLECSDTAGLNTAQNLEPVPDKCNFTLIKTSGSYVQDPNCSNAGTYTNSWTFTDACGNTISDYVQIITVQDTTPPTASDPLTISLNCTDNIPAADINVVTDEADNCSTPTVTFISDVSDNQSCPETITRTYRVTDACNNSIDVTQNIVINDDIAPTASNPPAINLSCTQNIPAPDISVVNDAADNCSNPVVTFISDVSDNQSCPETITRTYRVNDSCNNSIDVTQNIVINDDIAPTASNPPAINLSCTQNIPAPDISVVNDAADNCSNPVVTFISDVSDNQSCPETITRTYRVNDSCNNSIDVTQNIVINDDIAPTASNPPAINLSCTENIPAPDISIVNDAADNCSNPVVTFISDVTDNQSCPETITRTYRVSDSCNNFTDVTQNIVINDDIAPTGSNPVDINISCVSDIPDPDTSVVTDASDNCSNPSVIHISDVSDNLSCNETITRTYRISDACGNSIDVTQSIHIVDNIEPQIITEFDNEIYITCEEVPQIPQLEFADNCDQDLDIQFSETMNQIDNLNFDILRTWVVTDACNNQNTFNQSIYVNRLIESNTQYVDLCIEDEPLNVFALVPYTEVVNTNAQINEWNSDSIDLLVNGYFDAGNVELGEYEFINRISNNDCTWTTTIYVRVNDDCVYYPCVESEADVTISKMVTPNNDGYNDIFEVNYVLNEESNEVCDIVVKVEIFNRWGTKVFQSNNYNNDWAGVANSTAANNSNYLPTGTYYYIVELINGGLKPIQGFIYLGTE